MMRRMSQDLAAAKNESASILDLITKKELSPAERERMIKEVVQIGPITLIPGSFNTASRF